MASDDAIDELAESIGFEPERTVYGGSSIGEDMAAALGTGNGFRFPSVEDANKIINSFKDRRDSIQNRQERISNALETLSTPFAQDDTSIGYIKRAIDSLNKLNELNDSALRYVESYIEKIEKAKQLKQSDEEGMREGFEKSGEAISK